MIPLTLTITRAGMAKFTAAQLTAGLDLTIAAVGLTDRPIVAAPTLEALPGEFRRITMVSGKQVGDAVVHLTMRDEAEVGYTAYGFGLFLADGTLFAAYGQNEALFQKSPRATFLSAIDIAFPTGDITRLTFGNTDFLNPPATTEVKGVVELATEAEAITGTDMQRPAPVGVTTKLVKVSEDRLKALIDAINASLGSLSGAIGTALDGLAAKTVFGSGLVKGGGRNDTNRTLTVDAASAAQIRAGLSGDTAITPRELIAAGVLFVVEASDGYRRLSDGTVEQWGSAPTRGTEGAFSLNFARPFPSECTGFFTTAINRGGAVDGQTTIQEVALFADRADLFLQNHQSTNNDAIGFRWRAWGR